MLHISKLLPQGTIHFTGIGGIGMSGIAEILHNLGYHVQGSDISHGYVIDRLIKLGIKVFATHEGSNLEGVSLLVKSSAIKSDNIELQHATAHHIPIITRTEMLAELMRLKISVAVSGSHGKTTTTSLIASMFEASNLNPTVINGGVINSHGTNAYLGSGDFLIAEADESDGTFIKVPSTIAVVTNIDKDHLDYYGTYKKLKAAFRQFVDQLPFYGFGVLCIDHPEVRKLAGELKKRRAITYGIKSRDADFRAGNIKHTLTGSVFDVEISENINTTHKSIKAIELNTPGEHNVLNALAAIAIAVQLNFKVENIINGFKEFKGVKRRFTLTGEYNGIRIIDDYAHNPQKIEAALKAAKEVVAHGSKVFAVFQPHRYSRLNILFNDFTKCFKDADVLYVSEVYSAGEKPIEGINSAKLISEIQRKNLHSNIHSLASPDLLPGIVRNQCKPNDMVIFLGAGTITEWAYALPKQLSEHIKS